LFALGGNFYRATPYYTATKQAFGNCELRVQVSTKLNQPYLYTAKTTLRLSVNGRTEIEQPIFGMQSVTAKNAVGGCKPPMVKYRLLLTYSKAKSLL
jgi:hypothetical protein